MLKQKYGFTIVELVVVISVIGILAGVVTVAYGGWRQRLAHNEMQSDLKQAVTIMQQAKNFGSGYPMPADGKIPNFSGSPNVTVTWTSGTATTYCIEATSSVLKTVAYYATETKDVRNGTCAGGDNAAPVQPLPPYSTVVNASSPSSFCQFSETERYAQSGNTNCGAFTATLDSDRCGSPTWYNNQPGVYGSSKSLQLVAPSCGEQAYHYANSNESIKNNVNKWSVESWVKFSGTATSKAIVSVENQWGLRSTTNGFACDRRIDSPYQTNSVSSSGGAPIINRWYYVACTHDAGVMRLYVDGTLASTSNFADGINNGGNNFRFGSYGSSDWTGNNTQQLNGYIDEFAFYKNKVLTASEISERYNYHP